MLSLHPMSKSGQCRRRATQEQPSAARSPRSIGARTMKIDWHAALTPSHPLASRLCCKIGVMGIGKVQTGIAKREFGRRARKTAGLGFPSENLELRLRAASPTIYPFLFY